MLPADSCIAVDDGVDLPDKRRKHIVRDCAATVATLLPVFSDRFLHRWVRDCAFDDVEEIGYAATVEASGLFDCVLR